MERDKYYWLRMSQQKYALEEEQYPEYRLMIKLKELFKSKGIEMGEKELLEWLGDSIEACDGDLVHKDFVKKAERLMRPEFNAILNKIFGEPEPKYLILM